MQVIDNQLSYELDGPCDFIFMIHVAHSAEQRLVEESLDIEPYLAARWYVDAQGNRVMRLQAPAGSLSLRYRATVERFAEMAVSPAQEWPVGELPDAVLSFLLPSRYCESDLLSADAQQLFGALPPGLSRVKAISEWIGQHIEYRVGTTVATTTAKDVFEQRVGVCRDFAHLGITFCRALNIPARLVCGYAPFDEPPPDFHAVFEAFVGGRWVLFDPTGMSPLASFVRIACGRDAKDVAFATIYGPARMVSMAPCIEPVPTLRGAEAMPIVGKVLPSRHSNPATVDA